MSKNMLVNRICFVLAQDAARDVVINNIANKPTFSIAFNHAFNVVKNFELQGNTVLYEKLMELPIVRFNIPINFINKEKYEATISGQEIINKLKQFRIRLENEIKNTRPLYINYALEAILRANYAILHKNEFADCLKF